MSIAEKFKFIADEVYEKGKENEWNMFWDSFQKNKGEMGNYASIFSYEHWDEYNYNPKYTIKPTYSCNQMFYASHVTDTKVTIDLRLCTLTNQVFLSAKKLKTIRKIIVKESTTYTSAFDGCSALENITFEGVIGQNISFIGSPLLNKASITNIFEHLSDDVTGKALAFAGGSVSGGFEWTAEGPTEEWNSLVNSKPNWTINLI